MKPIGKWILLLNLFVGVALADESTVSLAGQWRFAIGPKQPAELTGTIRLPGTMDDAGLGPKNTKPADLSGPYRLYNYAGPAWYQRDIEIPVTWDGKRVTLFLERCRWVTTVWLDDKRVGSQDSLIAPHVYDFGVGVKPGKHRLTICVDNTVKLDMGKFVSAMFGGTWGNMNGIIGRIELNATPPVWIEDVQVYPNAAEKKAVLVKVRIGTATRSVDQKLSLSAKFLRVNDASDDPMAAFRTWDFNWMGNTGQAEFDMPVSPEMKLWDEFAPNLQTLVVTLSTAKGLSRTGKTAEILRSAQNDKLDTRTVRFGLRDFAVKGTQFTMNGRPVFLRGTLECSIWPLTGYPPMEVESWQRIYRIMKSYGLNHIRFHSWCPPEAAFTAADIEGIMIQAEGPMANVSAGNNPARDAFIEAEFKRIVDTYGNHPSFCLMTLGNEFGGKRELLTRWVDMLKQRDGRHLYSSASSAQKTANRQWTETPDGRGVHGPGTQRDLRNIVASDARPIIGHEVGQWMYWPDSREIKKWTGVMALKNFEMVRDDLKSKGLFDQEPQFVEASGKFATLLYKEEIEVLLRTPGYAGFSLLDLHDYPTQGTALIGPLDAFWDSKGFIAPEAYRRFCGPTVPLLRMPKRTYTADEKFEASADVAHYGPADLASAQPVWTIRDEAGHDVASGRWPAMNISAGKLTALGPISASLAKAKTPGKLTVTVTVAAGFSLRGPDAPVKGATTESHSNDWDIWVYPPKAPVNSPEQVVVCRQWGGAATALGEGKAVVLFPQKVKKSLPGKFLPVFWSPVWFPSQVPNTNGILCDPQHPAFAQFPTEFYSNWQWWELLNDSQSIILDNTPADYRPVVQVIDNFSRNHKLGNLFEARVGAGKLLVCSMDLPGLADKSPAARQLLHSLYAYAGSPAFKPSQTLEMAALDGMFGAKLTNSLRRLGAKVRADSEAPGYEAALAMDGDPDTLWHTKWEPSPAPMPHEFVIEFPREVTLTGITCLPRQDMANGRIARCEVLANGNNIATANWPDSTQRQTLRFAKPVTTRRLTLRIRSEVNGNPFAGMAELDVVE